MDAKLALFSHTAQLIMACYIAFGLYILDNLQTITGGILVVTFC